MEIEKVKSFYRNKNILVTGGAGFIGSHLTERLVEYGARVTILDNFSSGNLKNLTAILNKITIAYTDLGNAFSVLKATRQKDIVFHLAAFVSTPESFKKPNQCFTVNVDGTKNLLENCRLNNTQTIIYSSSCAIYGDHKGLCTEDTPPNPQSPYAKSKLEGEELCKQYTERYALNTACLRYFNVYGDRQNPQGEYAAVVAKFKYALQHNLPLTIYGNGNQMRDFIHVAHVVDANLLVGMQTSLQGDIFNVGTGKSITLLNLITQLEQELQRKSVAVTYQPARAGDILYSYANCEKIKKIDFFRN